MGLAGEKNVGYNFVFLLIYYDEKLKSMWVREHDHIKFHENLQISSKNIEGRSRHPVIRVCLTSQKRGRIKPQ
jgi:hypothetical protein